MKIRRQEKRKKKEGKIGKPCLLRKQGFPPGFPFHFLLRFRFGFLPEFLSASLRYKNCQAIKKENPYLSYCTETFLFQQASQIPTIHKKAAKRIERKEKQAERKQLFSPLAFPAISIVLLHNHLTNFPLLYFRINPYFTGSVSSITK